MAWNFAFYDIPKDDVRDVSHADQRYNVTSLLIKTSENGVELCILRYSRT